MSKPVQALPGYLSAPIDATQTSFSVRGLKDSRGNLITAMVGTLMHATIEPRSTANQEIISWTGITNLGNGIITLTGVTRNIDPQPPFSGLTGVVPHAAGVEIILTDTAKMWDEYPNVNETKTISARWTYDVRPRSTGADTDPTALVTKAELAAASITPSALGTITVSGIAAESITIQNVVWLDPSTGTWRVANANVLAELNNTVLGIALGNATIANPITPGVAILGRVSGFSGLSVGAVYVSDTGTISNTPGTNSKQVGIAFSATDIEFDPGFRVLPTIAEKAGLDAAPTAPSGANPFMTLADVGVTDYQVFTASGTWTKPSGLTGNELVVIQVWGGGGGGGSASSGSNNAGGGGGGGAFSTFIYRASALSATETITIGAGGAAGVAGGTSSFGTKVIAYGGGAGGAATSGDFYSGGGGGGGSLGAGNGSTQSAGNAAGGTGGTPIAGTSSAAANGGDSSFGGGGGAGVSTNGAGKFDGGASMYGGGGGGGGKQSSTGGTGGSSYYGGGGGGGGTTIGTAGTGGTSVVAGAGGAGGSAANGSAGTIPAGGGGGAGHAASGSFTGGAGARGEIRVWVIKN